MLPAAFVLVWASGYLAGELGTEVLPPLSLLLWRFVVAAVVLAAVAALTRAPWPRGAVAWRRLVVQGVLLRTVQFGGVYVALDLGVQAGLTSLLVGAGPLAVAALSVRAFGERLRPAQWAGLGLGVAGVALAVADGLDGGASPGGVLAALAGLAGFVAGTLHQKRFGGDMDLRTGAAVQLGGAALAALALALVADGGVALPRGGQAIGAVLWLALVNAIGAFTLLFLLLRRRPGGEATSPLFLVPPVTALLAVPVLGEELRAGALLGIAVAAVGVAFVTSERSPSRHRPYARSGRAASGDPDAAP